MNRTGFRLYDDPRELALRDALYRCPRRAPSGLSQRTKTRSSMTPSTGFCCTFPCARK